MGPFIPSPYKNIVFIEELQAFPTLQVSVEWRYFAVAHSRRPYSVVQTQEELCTHDRDSQRDSTFKGDRSRIAP